MPRPTFIAELSPTVDTNIYASGDAIAVIQEVSLEALRDHVHSFMLEQVLLTDVAHQGANIDVALFKAALTTSTFTLNNAVEITAADMSKLLGIVSVTTHFVLSASAGKASVARDLRLPLNLPAEAAPTLYVGLISRGTPTYAAATNLRGRLTFVAN